MEIVFPGGPKELLGPVCDTPGQSLHCRQDVHEASTRGAGCPHWQSSLDNPPRYVNRFPQCESTFHNQPQEYVCSAVGALDAVDNRDQMFPGAACHLPFVALFAHSERLHHRQSEIVIPKLLGTLRLPTEHLSFTIARGEENLPGKLQRQSQFPTHGVPSQFCIGR